MYHDSGRNKFIISTKRRESVVPLTRNLNGIQYYSTVRTLQEDKSRYGMVDTTPNP